MHPICRIVAILLSGKGVLPDRSCGCGNESPCDLTIPMAWDDLHELRVDQLPIYRYHCRNPPVLQRMFGFAALSSVLSAAFEVTRRRNERILVNPSADTAPAAVSRKVRSDGCLDDALKAKGSAYTLGQVAVG